MSFNPTPLIEIIKPEKTHGEFCIFIETQCLSISNPKASILFAKNINDCEEIKLTFDGFEFLTIDSCGRKILKGKVFINQTINSIVVKRLIAEPSYLPPTEHTSNEIALVADLKNLVKKSWNTEFNSALQSTINQSINQPTATHKNLFLDVFKKIPPLLTKAPWKFHGKKYIGIISVVALIVLFNGFILNKNTNATQKPLATTAEQMAAEQDAILNKAFKDIGIDREKLASDMSCFTE